MIRHSKHLGMGLNGLGEQVVAARGSLQPMEARKVVAAKSDAETANSAAFNSFSGVSGLPSNSSVSNLASPQIALPLLNDFLPQDEKTLRNLYREIYYYDSICGAAVDLLSTLPFGEFSLTGLDDEKHLRKYASSIEKMQIKNLLPILSVDYLVVGSFVGTLNWNDKDRIYDALLPHNRDFIELERVPVFGADPIVKLVMPPEIQKQLKTSGKSVFSRYLSKEMMHKLSQGGAQGITFDPSEVIYIDRPGMVSDFKGVSIFNRVLPIWLMEKAMIRGTLDQVWRRLRSILHITAGDENWEPTLDDFQALNGLFLAADHDPTGSIVTTRNGVALNEIRRGDDFFKWMDVADWARQSKLIALGVSEPMVTGDGNLSSVEGSISTTLQYFEAYRNKVIGEILYSKVFPTIAIANNYKKKAGNVALASNRYSSMEEEVAAIASGYDNPFGGIHRRRNGEYVAEFAKHNYNVYDSDLTQYAYPRLQWHSGMRSDRSRDYVEMLGELEERGVPVPIRMWAAATGMSLTDLIEQRDSDMKVREYLAPWSKAVTKFKKNVEGGDEGGGFGGKGGGGDDNNFSFASADLAVPKGMFGSVPPVGFANRKFDDEMEVRGFNSKGKSVAVSRKRQKEINESMNKKIAEGAANVHAKKNHKEKEAYTRKRTYSFLGHALK